jgi:hypothetical protein
MLQWHCYEYIHVSFITGTASEPVCSHAQTCTQCWNIRQCLSPNRVFSCGDTYSVLAYQAVSVSEPCVLKRRPVLSAGTARNVCLQAVCSHAETCTQCWHSRPCLSPSRVFSCGDLYSVLKEQAALSPTQFQCRQCLSPSRVFSCGDLYSVLAQQAVSVSEPCVLMRRHELSAGISGSACLRAVCSHAETRTQCCHIRQCPSPSRAFSCGDLYAKQSGAGMAGSFIKSPITEHTGGSSSDKTPPPSYYCGS